MSQEPFCGLGMCCPAGAQVNHLWTRGLLYLDPAVFSGEGNSYCKIEREAHFLSTYSLFIVTRVVFFFLKSFLPLQIRSTQPHMLDLLNQPPSPFPAGDSEKLSASRVNSTHVTRIFLTICLFILFSISSYPYLQSLLVEKRTCNYFQHYLG